MSVQAPSAPDLRAAGPRRRPTGPGRRPRAGHADHRRPRTARCTPPPTRAARAAAPILAANAEDLAAARAAGTPEAMLDRLALNPQRVDGIAAGLRQVAGLPDPIGEVLRGQHPAQRPAAAPAAGPARRDRHGLRGPAQRHRRRVRADAEVRQRGAAARQFVGGAVQRGAGHRAARRAGSRGPARRRRAAAAQRGPRHRHPPDPGPRTGRRRDPARGSGPDRRGGARCAGADHRDRRRQLPCLRARIGRPRRRRTHSAERQDPPAQRLQRRRDAADRQRPSPTSRCRG